MNSTHLYKRYWFEFQILSAFGFPPGIGIGCGITAIDLDDAINILDRKIFFDSNRLPFKKVIEDVAIRILDQGHVIPNIHSPVERGVWFLLGYE